VNLFSVNQFSADGLRNFLSGPHFFVDQKEIFVGLEHKTDSLKKEIVVRLSAQN
jgi:hypothetical protein